jgi:hypothetical protein
VSKRPKVNGLGGLIRSGHRCLLDTSQGSSVCCSNTSFPPLLGWEEGEQMGVEQSLGIPRRPRSSGRREEDFLFMGSAYWCGLLAGHQLRTSI